MEKQKKSSTRSSTADRVAHLISYPANIRYLTGFIGASANEHEAYVIMYRGTKYLLTNSLYAERAEALAKQSASLVVLPISRTRPLSVVLAEFTKHYKITGITIEEHDLTVSLYQQLRKALSASIHIRDSGRMIEQERMIKSTDELASIRKAARITDACYQNLLPYIRPGTTETSLVAIIEAFFRKHNAVNAFAPIVAFGTHTSQPHYLPQSGSKLTKQTLVLLDFGASVNGYASDMTRMVYLGSPPDVIVRAYNAVSLAQKNALLYLGSQKPCRGGKADSIARSTIKNMGFPPYTHSLGHCVGLEIHEAPRLTVHDDQVLKPGMVFTVEPGMYIEGKFGIRIEDLVALTSRGLDILSKTQKNLLTIR